MRASTRLASWAPRHSRCSRGSVQGLRVKAPFTGIGAAGSDRLPQLATVRLPAPSPSGQDGFPFSIPALRGPCEITLPGPVTFFAGENGSGKSTLLEALAIAAALPAVGRTDAARDDSLASQRKLAGALKTVWRRRTHRGFFLRAEDFFGFVQRLQKDRAEMEARIEEVEREYVGRSELARQLARGPAAASLGVMEAS
ncbi:MAG: AAA family ATPase [Gemmatimonadetes bacterium]|nr:AAA family ATPase [Gemmatimonadota bacterium]